MTPREMMLAAIQHEEVRPVPYTLAIETDIREPLDNLRIRDGYGSIWRVDQRPWHLETPVLSRPSFDGYFFPVPERFYLPQEKAAGLARVRERAGRRHRGTGLRWRRSCPT
jgi:hypothetical protein